jgi:D-alanyl-D-alanine dipeptidase
LLGSAAAQIKKPEPPAAQAPFERSLQAIVVTTPDWSSFLGKARFVERKNNKAQWKTVGNEFQVVIGRSGLGSVGISTPHPAPAYKREGDGRSPAGMFPLTFAFGTSDPGSKLPFTKLDEFTECVDDVNSTFYNRVAHRLRVGNFDWKSSEKMLEVGPQYDLGVFVAYNSYPVVPGRGSCIFLHIWKDGETGTSGCTAMARENLERIVKWLDPSKSPYLIQLTAAEYQTRRRALRLPKI